MAINDVLPLKAARHDATVKPKMVLGPGDTNDLISIVSFTFDMRRHLIRLASVPFTYTVWQSLVGFRLLTSVCEAWRLSRMRNLRRVGKNLFVDQSYEIFGWCREPLVLSNALARLSMSCFVQKIFAINSRIRRKTEQI